MAKSKKAHSIAATGQPLPLTEEQYLALTDEDMGICRSCGHEQGNCEPDMRSGRCEACGLQEVYGTEELLVREEIEIT